MAARCESERIHNCHTIEPWAVKIRKVGALRGWGPGAAFHLARGHRRLWVGGGRAVEMHFEKQVNGHKHSSDKIRKRSSFVLTTWIKLRQRSAYAQCNYYKNHEEWRLATLVLFDYSN